MRKPGKVEAHKSNYGNFQVRMVGDVKQSGQHIDDENAENGEKLMFGVGNERTL